MKSEDFRKFGHEIIDWIADYYDNIRDYPVLSKSKPKDILNSLNQIIPENGDNFEDIFEDFNEKIMPGITHWQHPGFMAYFPSNTSYESLLGEFLTAALGPIAFSWQTSPAAAELEELTMNWLRDLIGLPSNFHGVIQDTASTATLVSLLTAREKSSNYMINKAGSAYSPSYKVYASTEVHSSIDKAVKIAGIGINNLIKIPTNSDYSINTSELLIAIKKDMMTGKTPLAIVAAIGTTSSTAVDNLKLISEIANTYGIWLHVDAAYSGSALILPEYKHMIEGIEHVDSFVFNPHKWLFTNFDASAYFVKDKNALINTFTMMPEYLKTQHDNQVNNYRDWGIQLGRKFRALKLWFVLRSYGIKGLQDTIRFHIELGRKFEERILKDEDFEILAPRNFNLVCFRYKNDNLSTNELNNLNEKLLLNINDSGKVFITHTKLNGIYTLRFVIGKTYVDERDLEIAWEIILKEKELMKLNLVQ